MAVLKQFKNECAARYGIRSIGLFGSVARGDNNPDSDVDVFMELEVPDPFIMFDIREALQSMLGCKVDLIRPKIKTAILEYLKEDSQINYKKLAELISNHFPLFPSVRCNHPHSPSTMTSSVCMPCTISANTAASVLLTP